MMDLHLFTSGNANNDFWSKRFYLFVLIQNSSYLYTQDQVEEDTCEEADPQPSI